MSPNLERNDVISSYKRLKYRHIKRKKDGIMWQTHLREVLKLLAGPHDFATKVAQGRQWRQTLNRRGLDFSPTERVRERGVMKGVCDCQSYLMKTIDLKSV